MNILRHYLAFSKALAPFILLTLVLFTWQYTQASEGENQHPQGKYTELEMMKGERLFKGLLPFQEGFNDCASCHYTKTHKEIDWNPSAYDLAVLSKEDTAYLSGAMSGSRFQGVKGHEEVALTDKETELVKAYFSRLADQGLKKHKPVPEKTLIFFGTGFLMLLSLIELIFLKKIRIKAIPVLILLVALGFHIKVISEEAINLGRSENYAPSQPIKFSHKVHVKQNKIDCKYCHTGVDDSQNAGIPANNLCLNCHNVVREGSNSGTFEINKIHRAAKQEKPIEWKKVHDLPDHVFFSHATHVQNGNLDCAECHGQVEEMHIVEQVEDLSMGWCIECHRETEVDFDNKYYSKNFE
ncbi:MAG: cytochrome c family protein, partial [Bacteroidales bacterium]|nr:cytochrome c family protein [Bacteroidales bacterium]